MLSAAPEIAFHWRETLRSDDPARIRALVAATGRFSAEEIDIAEELALERLARGPASGYDFLLADADGRLAGYSCFGRIPCSETSWDLYWIVVAPDLQGRGLGGALMAGTEERVRRSGGRQLHADTSDSPPYEATRAFYAAKGFRLAAHFPDFYRLGDGRTVYTKDLTA